MSPNRNHKEMPPNAGAVFATAFLTAVAKQLPSSQETRGDDKLKQARDLVTSEVRTVAAENDLKVIEDKITHAGEMKVGLNTKSGFRKFLQAREYHKVANGVYRHVKFVSDRAFDRSQYQSQPSTSSETDDIYRTARSLYRCWLICKEAFPSSLTQNKWVVEAWNAACHRTDAQPNFVRQDEEIKCDSMKLLTDMKTKIKHAVDSSYEFDTSRAPDSISRNVHRAQALLAKTTFIYRDFNFGERPRHPYRRPIIQDVVNIMWFRNKDDIGIVFHEYFNPISFEVMALAVTMIECCIDEWSTGTYNESSWKEERYRTNYLSHLNSLRDLHTHGPHQEGRDLLRQIQHDLLTAARIHAGAPPDPTTGPGRLSVDALDAAVHDDPPEYDKLPAINFPSE